MTRNQYITSVKNWTEQQKEFVRRDVAIMTKLNETKSCQEKVSVSAKTAFILEKCFRKGVEIDPKDILTVLWALIAHYKEWAILENLK